MAEIPKIVRQRMAAQTPIGAHPDADVLTAFAEQRLAKEERAPVLAHLAECADCREIVTLAAPETPALVAGGFVPRRWWAMPAYQYGAAAAAIAAVAVGLVLLQQPQQRSSGVRTIVQNEAPAPPQPKQAESLPEQPPSSRASSGGARGMLSDRANHAADIAKAAPARPEINQPTEQDVDQRTAAKSLDRAEAAGEKKDRLAAAGAAGRDKRQAAESTEVTADSVAVHAASGLSGGGSGQTANAAAPAMKAEAKTRAATPAAPAANVAEQAYSDSRAADELAVGKAGQAVETQRAKLSMAKNLNATSPWRINAGRLQRFDSPSSSWDDVSIGTAQRLSVVASLGTEVWVGGVDGRMFYSNDQGTHWIATSTGGWSKDATFTGLTPTALRSVEVYLSNGERWRSADGGASWTRYH